MGEEITIPVALMHTGVAMGTVFLVLILISFVIYLLKFVPKLFEKKEKVQIPSVKEPDRQVSAPKPQAARGPVKKTTDPELVAVIAAAVAAAMTEETGVYVEPDGLLIRSIKKRSSRGRA
ncbi:MAG: OadG family protein [Eubacterium sp.]|nr:OadG family protein [Eubacterium sp.]